MKLKVLVGYIDKYTEKEHKVGDIVELPIQREKEINKGNILYVEKIEESK